MANLNLNKMAKQLAPAYNKASWGDVEDDVNLCMWFRKEAGEELTLDQAGKLREKMEAAIDKLPKVVIFVEGGVVTGCTSNDARLRVIMVDRDNLAEDVDKDAAEAEALVGAEDCTHDVY
jgi:hypothetical protein